MCISVLDHIRSYMYTHLQVKVGNIREITWQIDQTYEEITIPVGEGLLFKWSGANYHNLIEMASPQSTSSQCTFVDISTGSGQVK